MTEERLHQRVDEIFVAAIGHPVGERANFVESASKDDPEEVRQMVLQLIAADERVDTNFAGRGPLNLKDFTADDIADPRIGQRIDDYVIESRIASGGFGTVYSATRTEPYQETVAIKLLHQNSFATPAIVERVLREMQALSDLRHPNIVTQLRSNITSDGEPYIVMEFVDGVPLDEFCNDNQLSIDDRLKLFQTVCRAVEFAHSQGWVHRDLKPSNILVTADGVAKLLDFGIAKLTDSHANSINRLQTITHGPVGTPHYMSPEQFAGKSVGPPADIYALGAILYELLSGHRAFDVMCRGIDTVVIEAVQTAVREKMPQRPSTLVFANDTTANGISKEIVADQRAASPSSLRRCLRGDVDNIAMYALRKEPSRRYESASAVAEDIQRWLDHRPVLARPDSVRYRTKKFVRRNRSAIAVGAMLVLCTLVAFAASRQERRAITDRDVERSQKLMGSADSSLEADRIPEGILRLHSAFKAAPQESPYRDSAARLIAGWSRYLGRPLAGDRNLRNAFSEDGMWLAVAEPDGKVVIWNTTEMRSVGEFNAGDAVEHLVVLPQARRLLTTTEGGVASCWEFDSETSKVVSRHQYRLDGNANAISVFANEALLVTSEQGRIRLSKWDLSSLELESVAEKQLDGEIVSANFLTNRQLVVATKREGDTKKDRRIELWEAATLDSKRTLVESCTGVDPFLISSDHRFAAQGYRIGNKHHSVVIDAEARRTKEFEGEVFAIRNNGQFLLKHEQEFLVGDATTGDMASNVALETATGVRCDAAFGGANEILVGSFRSEPKPHVGVQRVPFRTSNEESASMRPNISAHSHVLPHPVFGSEIHFYDRIKFGPMARHLVFDNCCEDDSSSSRIPWLWSLNPFLRSEVPPVNRDSSIRSMAASNEYLVEISSHSIRCWDGEIWHQIPLDFAAMTCVAIADEPTVAIVGDAEGGIHVFDLPSLRSRKHIAVEPGQAIRSIATIRNDEGIVVATQNRIAVHSRRRLLNGKPHQYSIDRDNSAFDSVKSNGGMFGVSNGDRVRSYRMKNGRELELVSEAQNGLGHLNDFVVRHQQILTVSIREGTALVSVDERRPQPFGTKNNCVAVSLRNDGNVAVVGYDDGSIQFWDTLTQHRLSQSMPAGTSSIQELVFTSDGTQLVSTTESGETRIWDSSFRAMPNDSNLKRHVEVLTGVDVDASDGEHASLLTEEAWRKRYADWKSAQ